MKEVHLRRHAEKSSDGQLTENGIRDARELAKVLPTFVKVISSDSDRARETARLLTGTDPEVDTRAGYYMAPPYKSAAINALAAEQGLTFLEALKQYQDPEVLQGVDIKATELNELITELLESIGENEKALIVSHDLSISPAMALKGIALESITPLGGYVIQEDGSIRALKD